MAPRSRKKQKAGLPLLKEQNPGVPIRRFFTRPGIDPLEEVTYSRRTSVITGPDGSVVFKMEHIKVPETWSQLATDIFVSKYLHRAGVPGTGTETSARQVVYRIAHSIRLAGERLEGYFRNRDEAQVFEDELLHLLIRQKSAFNSPVWFNCGLDLYGIKGSGGNWYWDPRTDSIRGSADNYAHPQCSACFIQSVEDDLMSIFDLLKNEARLFKYGSGTGTNFSNIRGRMEKLSGGGTSSGLLSFLEVLDRGAGATKSGGTTRRAAKMVCLDLDHPEILDFIRWKAREEKKIAALIANGYSPDFDSEAYRTVSGQNSNNSVRVPDEFMQAYLDHGPWPTRLRTTGEIYETLDARSLMREIASAAWACADPGIQFDTTINQWNTCSASGRIRASNPCSEFMFLDDTACNLASLNLTQFLHQDGSLDIEAFRHAVRILIIAMEILVDHASYPTEKIALKSHRFRPLGLGYANLGALFMRNGLPYDSPEARALCAGITALMTAHAYKTSAEIAAGKGPFPDYPLNKSSMMKIMEKHRAAVQEISSDYCPAALLNAAREDWMAAVEQGDRSGYRNAQATVIAPTGTIGLLMDCDTTGIEPDYALIKFKKLTGGGYFRIVNQSVPFALKKLGYADEEIREIIRYTDRTASLEGAPHLKTGHLAVFDCANPCGPAGKRSLEPMAHLKMLAAAQPFVSGGISKTINLPNGTTVEEIERLYVETWKMGLKSVALYRNGCKRSQPLNLPAAEKELSGGGGPRCVKCGHGTIPNDPCDRCATCGNCMDCS